MENRGFDHYFGSMNGVRGFADRFPIPVPDVAGLLQGKTVWYQRNDKATGTKVLSQMYARWSSTPVHVDLDALWKELGVSAGPNNGVVLDAKAPLAAVRQSISTSR